MRLLAVLLVVMMTQNLSAQNMENDKLPYHQIPDYPENYGPGNIVSRMIDGLGYRYFWASEGLTEKDLSYAPSEEARNTKGTLEHLYGLSETIVNSAQSIPNVRPADYSGMSYMELREGTLKNLQKASKLVASKNGDDFNDLGVVFKYGEKEYEYPYWNMINGPIADAIYHTGQIVSFRRSSGNPINPGVNVFAGKTKE